MKTKTLALFASGFLAATLPLQAGPRTSANYSIATDTTDSGGSRGTSGAGGNYTNSGSISPVTGTASATTPAEIAKAGYIGQLFDVTGLQLTSASLTNTVNEGATLQLAAWQVLDDATFLAVPAASVAWSVAGGPLIGIDDNGLVTADIVYQETTATAQGIYLGKTGTLGLTVKNVNIDNYREYANDGIDDKWQVDYFGLPPNPLAAPAADPDGDGQTNAFEFTAGVIPNDPASRFTLTLAPVSGQPAQKNVIFAPRLTDRTYTVTARPALTTGSYVPLTNPSAPSDAGQQRTITDLSASGAAKFYRVEITKP